MPVYAQFINCSAIWSKSLTDFSVEIRREGTYEIFWIYKAVSRAFRHYQLLRLRLNSLKCVYKSLLGMEREAIEVPLATSVGLSASHKAFSCG